MSIYKITGFLVAAGTFVATCYFSGLQSYLDGPSFFDDPNTVPKTLSNKKILILGAGGVGSIIAQHLSACGIKSYVLVDFDTVNATNLNRQFTYSLKDIGENKITKLKSYLEENDPTANVSTHHKMIKSKKELAEIIENENDIDFIACCADTPQEIIQNIVTECAQTYNIPCSFCGVHLHYGTWGPLLYNNSDYEKFMEIIKKQYQSGCELRPEKPLNASIGFTNSIVSSLYSKDILMFLLGNLEVPSLSNIMKIDFMDNTIQAVFSLKDST